MPSTLLLLALLCPVPERAYFEIAVETNTEVSMYIKGQKIEPGTTYKTESLYAPVCVELEVRFVDGGEVRTKTFYLDLEPGVKTSFTLSIHANPPWREWCRLQLYPNRVVT